MAYVTIAGKYVKGADLTDSSAKWTQKVAGAGYKQVNHLECVLKLSTLLWAASLYGTAMKDFRNAEGLGSESVFGALFPLHDATFARSG